MQILRELCLENKKQIDFAFWNKADRIELCSKLKYGGLTPKKKLVNYALEKSLDTVIMIRRRKFDFYDTEKDINKLIKQVQYFNQTKIAGYVFGFLNKDNTINIEITKKFMSEVGQDKYVVFHMAFDLIQDKKQAIDQLIELGVKRILTKGGNSCAINNIESLKELKKYAKDKIEILIGGSVTKDNYLEIANLTKINQLHGRKIY